MELVFIEEEDADLSMEATSQTKPCRFCYEYEECSKSFCLNQRRKSNQATHEGIVYACSSPNCTYKANRRDNLQQHQLAHEYEYSTVCTYRFCTYTYRYVKYFESNGTLYACLYPDCGQTDQA